MAKGTLGQVIQRAISDAAFRNRLRTDPGGALSGFDLTPAERSALQSGDAAKLASFGVDQRMSKAFAMGEAAAGVTKLVGTDVGIATTITDGGTPLGTNAILEDAGGSVRNAVRDDGGPFGSGAVDAGNAPGREGSAFITADEAGNDASASALSASDSNATDAFLTADEMGNNVAGNAATAAGSDSSAGTAYITSDEAGGDQSAHSDSAMANPEGYEQPDPNAG